jgi:hypothetical protein
VQDADLERAVNDSGFPMQVGLKHLVETSGTEWNVALSEHAWHDPVTGDDRFLDMALRRGIELLVIECKRSRETEWIFLREPTNRSPNNQRRLARAWATALKINQEGGTFIRFNGWQDVQADPRSPIAQYCVIRKNGQRTEALLERIAAEVVRATEAVASQNLGIHRQKKSLLRHAYVPVIVSTARLFVCDFDPRRFDPQSGEIPDNEFTEFPMVRFSKSFSHPTQFRVADSLERISDLSGNSVLVVQAMYFLEFLRNWHLEASNDHDLARELWGT